MIRRAFPRLAIVMPRHYGDHSPERFRWDGPTDPDPDAASASAAGAEAGG